MSHRWDEFTKSLAKTSVILLAILAVLMPVPAATQDLALPDETGPYHVGVTTFSATMFGGRATRIQVFYPTHEASDNDSLYTVTTPVGAYKLRSPLGAVHEAQPAPGRFPLIVYDHGGQPEGRDFQRVTQIPLHEALASHGFILVVALHSGNEVHRVLDLSLVIDILLTRNATESDLLFNSINSQKIGVSGFSAGGSTAIGVVSGWAAEDIDPDGRVKAMVLYEPGSNYRLADARGIEIPYLIMGGSQNRNGISIPTFFNTTVNATPRIYVLNPNATHFN